MNRVFISSVQKEFAQERILLAKYFREDSLLNTFFEPFLFEEVAANSHPPQKVYLTEVKQSSIYIGILGCDYGTEDALGISPTEREYDEAKIRDVPRWIFIKGDYDLVRSPKENLFIEKAGNDVSRKRFVDIDELKHEVYNSCILYLKQTGKIQSSDFDDSLNLTATLKDIDIDNLREFVETARKKRNFPLKSNAKPEKILSHLNMFREGKIVNSALLAFATNPQHFFLQQLLSVHIFMD
ncbi:MAG: DUF4062 domain-containing protein [Bacteroidetes bacterium]|nr:DUF4062 domain-containing protein [Bacteroidota bacterium]